MSSLRLLADVHISPLTVAALNLQGYDTVRTTDLLLATADETIERIDSDRRFKNDTDRLEKLFELYTKMTAQQASPKKSINRKRGK